MQQSKTDAFPNVDFLAFLYLQLARMEESGITHIKAFETLAKTKKNTPVSIQKTLQYLKSGRTIAESGYRAGLFQRIDHQLLKAGEESGQLNHIYRQLAEYYTEKSSRARKIKSRLFTPLAILFLSLLIQPIPALFTGDMTVAEYLLASFGAFAYLLFFLYLLWRLPFWLTEGQLRFLGLRTLIFKLQLQLPVITHWIKRRQIRDFLQQLGLLLSAGIPALQAVPIASGAIKNALLASTIDESLLVLNKGYSLYDSFSLIPVFNTTVLQLINSGEQSGKLADTLLHYVKNEAEDIRLQEELLAEWIPRIIYLSIALWIAYSIIAAYMDYFSALDASISNLS